MKIRRPKRKEKPPVAPGDCPECGCNASELIEACEDQEGRACERRECDHCGASFTVEARRGKPETLRATQYVEKRIPICPRHQRPMHDNGRSLTGRTVYYICPVPGCGVTDKGTRRIV